MTLSAYTHKLQNGLSTLDQKALDCLIDELYTTWISGRQLLICGNGGSAANAMHWANDFVYGLACGIDRPGMRAIALPANQAVLTCLGNDTGYDNIFAEQVHVYGQPGDMLVVLSGSGNSANIVAALKTAKDMDLRTHALLGYDGGKARDLVDNAIHMKMDDMQIAEDAQLIIGHYVVKEVRQRLISSMPIRAQS